MIFLYIVCMVNTGTLTLTISREVVAKVSIDQARPCSVDTRLTSSLATPDNTFLARRATAIERYRSEWWNSRPYHLPYADACASATFYIMVRPLETAYTSLIRHQ